jgi:type II secretory pathway component GspD/PulD (secretin)
MDKNRLRCSLMQLAWMSGLVSLGSLSCVSISYGQFGQPGTGVAIQLPTTNQFGISTAVMVPDAGATRLGGVRRGASGLSSRGVPMLSNIPGVNPLFRNQALGSTYSAGQASVHVHLIVSKEIEADVLAEAERRSATRQTIHPNGSPETQQRAAFITRNIGRR